MQSLRLEFLLPLAGAGLLCGGGVPARAAAIAYSDPTAWAAATTGVTTIGFEGVANSGSVATFNTSTGYSIDGVNFTGPFSSTSYELEITDSQFATPYYNFNSGASLVAPNWYTNATYPYIHVTLPTNTTAIGVNLATVSPNALTYQVTLSDGEAFTVSTASRPNLTFFGVTNATPITYANFQVLGSTNSASTSALMDNFAFGQAQNSPPQTPEACTFLLIGGGLVGMRWLHKRRKTAITGEVPSNPAPGSERKASACHETARTACLEAVSAA